MSRIQANGALVLAALIWGSTFVVQKTAFPDDSSNSQNGLGPMMFGGLRFSLGALVVIPLAVYEHRRKEKTFRILSGHDLAGFILCGGLLWAGSYCQQLGIIQTTVANAGFLTALYVPLVPFLALLAFKRRPHWTVWPAAAASAAGAYLINDSALTGFGTGDLWILVGAGFWACHLTTVSVMVHRTDSPLQLAAVQFSVCGIVGLIGGSTFEIVSLLGVSAVWFEIAYAGLLSVGLAFTLQAIAQNHTHPATAAIILSSEMLFAALSAVLVLGERLNGLQMAGATLILSGIMLVEVIPLLKDIQQ